MKSVTAYTDGACVGNPGPGGYAAILVYEADTEEFCGGFCRTTNNRMEIIAAIKALENLTERSNVVLYSDSEYLVKAVSLGWAKKWKSKGWRRGTGEPALNPDLWERLLRLCEWHSVDFRWTRGHNGNPLNERCDRLAVQASHQRDLPPDEGYGR